MVKVTIGFALALILLGSYCYFATGREHPTAMIPAYDGFLILFGGMLALKPNLKMHGMHVAVLFGLLGFIGAVVSMIKRQPTGIALVDMGGMAILTGIFTALCVRSFIQARRARQSQA